MKFAWQTFASLRSFSCLVYVSTYCVPIALLRQNKPFRLLYLGHAQITSCILSRSNCKRGNVQNPHVQTVCGTVIFETLGLIRLGRFLSYTNHESGKSKAFTCKLRDNTIHSNAWFNDVLPSPRATSKTSPALRSRGWRII